MTMEITRKAVDGPPTLNRDGNRIFRIRPMIRNGKVRSIIVSPLPTSVFSFIFFPPMFLSYSSTFAVAREGNEH
jgi:hypothetical protein